MTNRTSLDEPSLAHEFENKFGFEFEKIEGTQLRNLCRFLKRDILEFLAQKIKRAREEERTKYGGKVKYVFIGKEEEKI